MAETLKAPTFAWSERVLHDGAEAIVTQVYPDGTYETDAKVNVKVPPSALAPLAGPIPLLPKDHQADSVDPRDLPTPDNWVKRHRALTRLTGMHPFNCDTPAALLLEQSRDMITPNSLHYVRNHASVPRIDAAKHVVTFQGLVDRPCSLSMDDLKTKFKKVELPCWLSCAGNRRAEQNAFKKGVGFNWNSGSAGMAVWGGCWLKDVLEYVGIKSWDDGAQHVEAIGVDKVGGKHEYGTSVERWKAMETTRQAMVAWEMNGAPLPPDHGFPVRIILPGMIGGQMIKFLYAVNVIKHPSRLYMHLYDNRLLPSIVDQTVAAGPAQNGHDPNGWWSREDFKINDHPINSVIVYPRHNDVLPLQDDAKMYRVEGYAYAGGGRKVIRCELSLDGGASYGRLPLNQDLFFLCDIKRLEAEAEFTQTGQYWGWVHWSADVPWSQLKRATQLTMCAWNASHDRQPTEFQWNITGMLNNTLYRVNVHPVVTHDGKAALHFVHPNCAGNRQTERGRLPGGWWPKEAQRRATEYAKL